MRIDPKIKAIMSKLEQRSKSEQLQLEELRKQGGSALRNVASEFMLDVGPEIGLLLNMLVCAKNAKTVVEVGSSVGYSTLWMAEAVRQTKGKVISYEVDAVKIAQARANLAEAGLAEFVEFRDSDISKDSARLPPQIDFVFLDHWKELYSREFKALWPRLKAGGLLTADNIIIPEKNREVIQAFLTDVRDFPDARSLTLNIGDGLQIISKEFV